MENCEPGASYTTNLTALCRESSYNRMETSFLPGHGSPGDGYSAGEFLLISVHGGILIQEINLKSHAVVSLWHLWREILCHPITLLSACSTAQKTSEQNCFFYLTSLPLLHVPHVSSERFLLISLTKRYCQHCTVIAEYIVILGTGLASCSAWVGSKTHTGPTWLWWGQACLLSSVFISIFLFF